MFVWTSGFQNPLVHNDFNMFVDELTKSLNNLAIIGIIIQIILHIDTFYILYRLPSLQRWNETFFAQKQK